MRLHHTTTRTNLTGIARVGFINSQRFEEPELQGVFLTDQLWINDGVQSIEDIALLGPDEVLLAFDIPDDLVAERELVYDDPRPRYREWCVPSEMADRYFAGVIRDGDPPLSTAELAAMHARSSVSQSGSPNACQPPDRHGPPVSG